MGLLIQTLLCSPRSGAPLAKLHGYLCAYCKQPAYIEGPNVDTTTWDFDPPVSYHEKDNTPICEPV